MRLPKSAAVMALAALPLAACGGESGPEVPPHPPVAASEAPSGATSGGDAAMCGDLAGATEARKSGEKSLPDNFAANVAAKVLELCSKGAGAQPGSLNPESELIVVTGKPVNGAEDSGYAQGPVRSALNMGILDPPSGSLTASSDPDKFNFHASTIPNDGNFAAVVPSDSADPTNWATSGDKRTVVIGLAVNPDGSLSPKGDAAICKGIRLATTDDPADIAMQSGLIATSDRAAAECARTANQQ